ncbi:MAG: hypothetical protein RIE08_01130 [Acidimicrobiales bacterium]
MIWRRLLRAEIRKLTSTRMPLAFVVVLAAISATTASAVIWGKDFDGTKTFVSTAADQRSLVAFAANATVIGALYGAIAVSREYAHGTVIPTFLSSPRRHRATTAQSSAIALGGAVIGLLGAGFTVAAVAASLTTTEFGFSVSAAGVVRVIAAAAFSGAVGALLGGGIGAVVRNTGGAVVGVVLALVIGPPLIVQLISDASRWIPAPLAIALSGVDAEAAGLESQVDAISAVGGLMVWALVPTVVGLWSVQRRDVA